MRQSANRETFDGFIYRDVVCLVCCAVRETVSWRLEVSNRLSRTLSGCCQKLSNVKFYLLALFHLLHIAAMVASNYEQKRFIYKDVLCLVSCAVTPRTHQDDVGRR